MDGFFSEQPCYRIEILEWINEEDITDEWRYIWKHDPPEPVYEVMMGGFVDLHVVGVCGKDSAGRAPGRCLSERMSAAKIAF